jgi:hypothetical protein
MLDGTFGRPAVEVAERLADGLPSDEERAGDGGFLEVSKRLPSDEERAEIMRVIGRYAAPASQSVAECEMVAGDEGEESRLADHYQAAAILSRYIAHPLIVLPLPPPDQVLHHIQYLHRTTVPAIRRSLDALPALDAVSLIHCLFGNPFRPVTIAQSWQTPTAVAIARTIYDERGFQDLPVLADALEDAGGTDADILNHLRGPGPHVRGCWVVDLLL